MTSTRPDSVLTALNDILPPSYTWEERCDSHFRASFPCGIAPMFERTQQLTICIDQIVQAGAAFDDHDFEFYLSAIITFFFDVMTALFFREPTAFVLRQFEDQNPEDASWVKRAAELNDMSVAKFVGLDRRP
jgi:hypothetical protein